MQKILISGMLSACFLCMAVAVIAAGINRLPHAFTAAMPLHAAAADCSPVQTQPVCIQADYAVANPTHNIDGSHALTLYGGELQGNYTALPQRFQNNGTECIWPVTDNMLRGIGMRGYGYASLSSSLKGIFFAHHFFW